MQWRFHARREHDCASHAERARSCFTRKKTTEPHFTRERRGRWLRNDDRASHARAKYNRASTRGESTIVLHRLKEHDPAFHMKRAWSRFTHEDRPRSNIAREYNRAPLAKREYVRTSYSIYPPSPPNSFTLSQRQTLVE